VPVDDSPLHPLPASFPTRLTRLLNARFHHGGAGITLMPCELIHANGQRLKSIVQEQAQRAYGDPDFSAWLDRECLWVDTLVDRIVSATIEPVGAVAEPYGLWAIRDTPGLELPCRHPDVQVVDDISPFEQRKLHILNLSHTWLVHHWRASGLTTLRFVREAMNEPALRQPLETMLREEVLPVLERQMPGMNLDHYLTTTLERFDNPFLDHRLEDIAQHHAEKLRRRLLPVHEMGRTQGYPTPQLENVLKAEGVI
jgi:tagaturonate reductase